MTDKEFQNNFPFDSARKFQRELIEAAQRYFDEGKKYVLMCVPTAVGKSAISLTLARYYGKSYFLTSQKTLQEQYQKDFKKYGMTLIKGKYNYTCSLNPTLKCDMGACKGNNSNPKLGCVGECPYVKARNKAYAADLTTLNYPYFFNMVRTEHSPQIPREFLVLDECIRKGQLVTTDKGLFPIEDIRKGDLLLSYNTDLNIFEYKEVIQTFENLHKSESYDHFLQIEMEDGRILEVTPNHKIYTSNRGYVRADELNEEDDIVINE
jgi:hypothetical protein